MATDYSLRARWLQALRASTRFAQGRECDYARAEGDADRFDPLGLLALTAGYECNGHGSMWRCYPMADGAWLSRHGAAYLAREVGLDPALLPELCELADDGWNGSQVADWVERNSRG